MGKKPRPANRDQHESALFLVPKQNRKGIMKKKNVFKDKIWRRLETTQEAVTLGSLFFW